MGMSKIELRKNQVEHCSKFKSAKGCLRDAMSDTKKIVQSAHALVELLLQTYLVLRERTIITSEATISALNFLALQ